MKIGMLTGLWFIAESAPVSTSLERIAALGLHYCDLHGVFHAGPAHLTSEDCVSLKAQMSALGLEPRNYVLHAPYNLASATDTELEQDFAYLCHGIDLALGWGIHQLMLNAGQWAYGVNRSKAWGTAVHFLQRVCDYAQVRQVLIAIESEPYVWFLVNDITSTLKMVEDVDRPNFTVLVDLGHMALARESPEDLERLNGLIVHAHFSDHELNRHTNQVIGSGTTRTAEYLAKLKAMDIDRQVSRFGYDQLVVSFELGAPGDRIPDPDDRVRQSLDYVLEIAPYMTIK